MQTKHARKILRQYHEAVKAVLDANPYDLTERLESLQAILPQADEAVKALTERFP